jgi:hypothetical protein
MSEQIAVRFATPLVVVHQQAGQPQVAVITLTMGDLIFEGVSLFMPGQAAGQAVSQHSSATMQAGSMGTVSVKWVDTAGNSVKVDGATKWTSTDESIVQVTGGETNPGNPLINNIFAPGPLGSAQVHATADADLDATGVKPVTAILDVTVIGGEAVGGEIKFESTGTHPPSPGGPQKQPAARR